MTNHSDPTRPNLLKRSIISNKNTRYKGSDIRTNAVSKNGHKKQWTSTLFLRLISIRCIFARSTIATLRVVIKINRDLIYYWWPQLFRPICPLGASLPCLPTAPGTKPAPSLSAAQCCDLILSLFFSHSRGKWICYALEVIQCTTST